MTGQALLLLSEHASYMTGGEYFVDGSVISLSGLKSFLTIFIQRASDLVNAAKIKGLHCNISVQY